MIKTLNKLFVTMFGLGKIPKIPGTFGSLATVIILYIFFHILNLSSIIILIFIIIVFIYSFSAISAYTKDNENKDPKEVIIDEFIGQSIPIYTRPTGLSFVPPFGPAIPVIETLILAFEILDRLLTIAKQHS